MIAKKLGLCDNKTISCISLKRRIVIELQNNSSVEIDIKSKLGRVREVAREMASDQMAGWVDLPENYDRDEVARISTVAKQIQANSKYLVCIGIGGSYLGHRAVIEALGNTSSTQIIYAGQTLSPLAIRKVLRQIGEADWSINVISKSGTTTEPAIAFRIFKQKLIEKYGETEARRRIYATTDSQKGALHDEAVACGYERFVVPDNIGGRYSVLTAVGLLPLAVAGVDIAELLDGAREERQKFHDEVSADESSENNALIQYAVLRQSLYTKGYETEILATFEPNLRNVQEWWKQLYGESEGKEYQGIFPASVVYTTDLHSLGQYLQQGRRNIFETFLKIRAPLDEEMVVPTMSENLDGLQYLEGKTLDYVNGQAMKATILAHSAGEKGIPVIELTMPDLSARSLGGLIYFFEMACAISAKLAGVNPFDQPGVEDYKTAMFHLLGKPGF